MAKVGTRDLHEFQFQKREGEISCPVNYQILSPVVEDLRDSAEEPDRPFERAMLNSGVRNRWHHAHARKLKQILNRNADLN